MFHRLARFLPDRYSTSMVWVWRVGIRVRGSPPGRGCPNSGDSAMMLATQLIQLSFNIIQFPRFPQGVSDLDLFDAL